MPAPSQSEQQTQLLRSFRSLLDPTDLLPGHRVADLYSLRHLCLQSGGIPDAASHAASSGWLRAQAWRVLLGYLGSEKSEWSALLDKRRGEYYQFVADVFSDHQEAGPSSQQVPGGLGDRDALLDQIYRDLARSRKNAFAFYRQEVASSESCPLSPHSSNLTKEAEKRLKQRHVPLKRLEAINADYAHAISLERASRGGETRQSTQQGSEDELQALTTPVDEKSQKPFITLQPASPNVIKTTSTPVTPDFVDHRWHSLLRILYIYALLNPSVGYVQGMNEVLFILLFVMGTSTPLPSNGAENDEGSESADASAAPRYVDDTSGAHAEADAFWCFSSLVGEIREVYNFDGIDHASARMRISNERSDMDVARMAGMSNLLLSFGLRLKWLDEPLWRAMRDNSLDPRLPYYSLRWLACLASTELSLPSIVRVWDALFAESSQASDEMTLTAPKLDFLIDVCCSMLITIRGPILQALSADDEDDAFSGAMDVIQSFPDDDIGPVIEMACLYRQRRLAAPLTGDGPPSVDDDEDAPTDLRNRALSAFREWRSSSTPLVSSSLIGTPRRIRDPSIDREVSTSASPAARFKRYAEAFQSSDAAASLSKASTNWQAKAMATWNGSRQATPTRDTPTSTASPLNEIGSSFLQRLRAASENAGSPSRGARRGSEQVHPALRWSRDSMPPPLPIPNVHDSPPQPVARGHERLGSSFGGLQGMPDADSNAAINPRSTGGSMSSAASLDASDQHTSNSSPAPTNLNRFAHLPSLQHAAAAGMRGGGSPAPKAAGGPKPLLLQNAARPPREHSNNGSVAGDEPASRKVSSGPMAANVSPRGSAFTRRRGENGSSSAASQRDSAHTITSFGSGVHRSYDSRAEGMSPAASNSGDEVHIGRAVQSTSSVPSLPPNLPSAVHEKAGHATSQALDENGHEDPNLQRSKATVSAMAFGGRSSGDRKTIEVERSGNSEPGRVASSADVPLTQQSTLRRNIPRRESSAITAAEQTLYSDGLVPSTKEEEGASHAGEISLSRPSSLSRPRGPRGSTSAGQSMTYSDDSQRTSVQDSEQAGGVARYTLTDGPVAQSGDEPAPVIRRGSNSSSRRSSGAYRNRRTISSAKREAGMRTSSRTGQSDDLLNEREEADGAVKTVPLQKSPESDGDDDQIIEDGDVMIRHRRISRNATNRLAVIAPGQSLTIESGTSVTPSPGPDEGKVLDADELMKLLHEGHGTQKERAEQLMAQHGVTETQLRAMTTETNIKPTFGRLENHQLLGPRPQIGFLRAPSEGHSEGGATSEDEFYDASAVEGQRTPEIGKTEARRPSYMDEGTDAIGKAMAAVDGDDTIIEHDDDGL